MYRVSKLAGMLCAIAVTGISTQGIWAGHPMRHSHHHHQYNTGATAAVAFAVGAVAGTLLASPPPPPAPPMIVHPYPYIPPGHGNGPVYYGGPPVVQREIIYRDRPTPVYVPAPMTEAALPPTAVQSMTRRHSGMTRVTNTPVESVHRPPVGTVVDRLPTMAGRTERQGIVYFEENGVFYLPIRVHNEPKFVVVQP